ncbi:MAG: FKBP-type peptidyl-prolyl cis-trans isomerase [Bacteroidales bacterium]|nr:FKBP-type peptidyl-prolyl cis-trans isomerase [Bacteroidales bacterium]
MKFHFTVLHVITLLVFLLAISCDSQQKEKTREKKVSEKKLKESLIHANKKALKAEEEQIKSFMDRYEWDMKKTGRGLRYMIYEKGAGPQPDEKDLVTIAYTVRRINGNVMYSSENQGPKKVEIGRSRVESGLEEGLKLMHQGAKAKLIIPSHLAYGLIGDQKKIKGKATLIYDVEVKKVEKR